MSAPQRATRRAILAPSKPRSEKDEPFLVELLTCFFSESHPRLHNVMAAALAYRRGETHFNGKPIETVVREEAHALKGSAANVRLLRITKVRLVALSCHAHPCHIPCVNAAQAAENCELPIKAICPPQAAPESVDGVAKRALLDRLCCNPDEQIGVLVVQFRAFVAFMEGDAREKVRRSWLRSCSPSCASAICSRLCRSLLLVLQRRHEPRLWRS